MWVDVPLPLALQNHLLQVRHLTTQEGEWMPQYLQHIMLAISVLSFWFAPQCLAMCCLRACMCGKFFGFFSTLQFQAHHAVHRNAVETFIFIVFKDLGLVVVIVGT